VISQSTNLVALYLFTTQFMPIKLMIQQKISNIFKTK